MDLSSNGRTVAKSSVVAGSVWETRMNEFKGGIKVFNGEESNDDGDESLKKGQAFGGVAVSGKRKTWKNESFEGFQKNPIQTGKGKAEEQSKKSPIRVAKGKDLSLSVDGNKKIPIQVKKGIRDLSKSVDGIERTSIHIKKQRSDIPEKDVEFVEGIEGNSAQSRKGKSDSVMVLAQSGNGNGNDNKVLVFDDQKIEGNEEHCKEFSVCQEMVNSSNGNDNKVLVFDDDDEFYEEEEEIEVVNEKKSFEIKEMNAAEEKPNEMKKLPEEQKFNKGVNEVNKLQEDKPSKVANEVKKISQFHNKTSPFSSSTVNKQTQPVVKQATSVYKTAARPTNFTPSSDYYYYHSFPQTHNNLQNIVDLVMWRDISKSALIFGIGTFIIISSSYTEDLNISFITVISYVGLVYLAAIFLYRSIICRGVVDIDESSYVLGEEEAIWVLKLVLPYLNEFLLKLKALFSGDPSTTMKLAVLLFVLARYGSSITIWKMAKLGFFGVFTVPKICSSYSHQITAYGKFWIGRFQDGWESCSHKKAVAVVIFTLVWNLSSIVARIWAAFMLFVAFRYYQQKMVTDDDWVEPETGPSNEEESRQGPIRRQRHGLGPSKILPNKLKKRS